MTDLQLLTVLLQLAVWVFISIMLIGMALVQAWKIVCAEVDYYLPHDLYFGEPKQRAIYPVVTTETVQDFYAAGSYGQ